jgi:hypothetical protein
MATQANRLRIVFPRLICAAALAFAPAAMSPALAIDPGQVTGSFTVDGKDVPLRHVTALRRENADKLGLAEGPEIRLLMTDKEVAPSALDSITPQRIRDAAGEIGFSGILISYEPSSKVVGAHLTLFVPGLADPMGQAPSLSVSNSEGLFQKLVDADNRLTGAIENESGGFGQIPPYKLKAEFGAPMFHEAPAKQRLTGAAALESAPAKTVLANIEAFWNLDLAKAKSLATAARWRQMEPMLANAPPLEVIHEQMKQGGQTPETAAKSIDTVIIREADAIVILREPSGGRGWQELWMENGAWRLR